MTLKLSLTLRSLVTVLVLALVLLIAVLSINAAAQTRHLGFLNSHASQSALVAPPQVNETGGPMN